jgi:catechol 2,3-dioxygenase-like lactoylglutathione lyase family enzyme
MVHMNLEVDIIPVTDVERSRQFYERLGWRLDDDAYGGLYDPYPSSDYRNDRQRSYGGLYDPDYANYRSSAQSGERPATIDRAPPVGGIGSGHLASH